MKIAFEAQTRIRSDFMETLFRSTPLVHTLRLLDYNEEWSTETWKEISKPAYFKKFSTFVVHPFNNVPSRTLERKTLVVMLASHIWLKTLYLSTNLDWDNQLLEALTRPDGKVQERQLTQVHIGTEPPKEQIKRVHLANFAATCRNLRVFPPMDFEKVPGGKQVDLIGLRNICFIIFPPSTGTRFFFTCFCFLRFGFF